jgi:excisionase family DNA binding protein
VSDDLKPTPNGDGLHLALRPRQAARALGISERLLWSMTNRGEIPYLRIGTCVVYPIAELERWLAERVKGAQR